jgi:outer membrane protein OmpA-like peptidoglycan-associated protein
MDSMDKCRDEAEDKDGFQDDDGCPDFDNDGDGVLDMADKCPTLAEDKDGVQDDDGCPDKDNDNDGIEDSMDKCPDQAETINGNADEDGCPDPGDSAIALTPSAVELLESIEFKGSALKPTASRVLGQVAATLKAHPEILRIKISVHVNPAGKDIEEKTTTEERAMAIREWLIKAGISADRVSGAGMGGTKPLLKGKKSPVNERVEIIILERK